MTTVPGKRRVYVSTYCDVSLALVSLDPASNLFVDLHSWTHLLRSLRFVSFRQVNLKSRFLTEFTRVSAGRGWMLLLMINNLRRGTTHNPIKEIPKLGNLRVLLKYSFWRYNWSRISFLLVQFDTRASDESTTSRTRVLFPRLGGGRQGTESVVSQAVAHHV